MRTIKIVATSLNGSSAEIPATSISASGKVRSIRKDGTFISGRLPLKEEESLLWYFRLTTKEKIANNNTKLVSIIHVPEVDIDEIDDAAKAKINLYTHLKEHQVMFHYEEVEQNGQIVKKQANKNYKQNHLLSFELIDITSKEDAEFRNERSITKYRSAIDDIYDKDETGKNSFLDLCYGMNVSGCYKNAKRHNYNLLIDKLKISPMSFERYWNDEDKELLIIINKGKKLPSNSDMVPYITSDEHGMHFYKKEMIGKKDEELKLFFKSNREEYDYLKNCVAYKPSVSAEIIEQKIDSEITKAESTKRFEIEHDVPTANVDTNRIFGNMNREAAAIVARYKKAQDEGRTESMQKTLETLAEARVKFAKNIDYFNNRVKKTELEKGIELPERLVIEA